MTSRLTAHATTFVVALVLLFFGSASAALAADEVGVSTDGISWSSSLVTPLFDPSVRWVPGDTRTSEFFVRNQTSDDSSATVRVETTATQAQLDANHVKIETRIADGAWQSANSDATATSTHDLAAGKSLPVQVRVSFLGEATNTSQDLGLDLNVSVTLSQTDTGSDNGSGDGSGSGDGLAVTGGTFQPLAAVVGVAAMGAGALLIAARRRRTGGVRNESS